MPVQTVWKGSISFGLVSIPVRLVSATQEKDVSFRQVHAADGGRIRYKRVCEAGGHEVAYADIAKGYELPGGQLVVLTDEDFEDLPITSSRSVEVLGFVPFSQIDPTSLNRAYYAEPTGDTKPYALLRDSLERSGRVGVVKVALRNKERLAVLRSFEGTLIVQTMLWPDEIRKPEFDFLGEDIEVRKQEMAMAESYIDTLSGDFDPEEYHDDYREALLKVVEAKAEGAEVIAAPEAEPAEGKVVDLMEALRRSVEEAKQNRAAGKADAEEAPAPAKKTAKKAAAKRKSA
ncbi:Ku protein [Jiangella alba]|uniref:Non-homologous end joining protein Ku n=1 Tax=Jiangella alba TaxID=561176 RepID=A0A1H5KMF5_9ACTN|nr:Ku protein [Jiangella alba]SEE65251.1 DNA end-binding protein Ku [Jiangella alba]